MMPGSGPRESTLKWEHVRLGSYPSTSWPLPNLYSNFSGDFSEVAEESNAQLYTQKFEKTGNFRALEFWKLLESFGHVIVKVLKRGCSRGWNNWGTLRIPREDWGTLGKIRGITTPLKNPILFGSMLVLGGEGKFLRMHFCESHGKQLILRHFPHVACIVLKSGKR